MKYRKPLAVAVTFGVLTALGLSFTVFSHFSGERSGEQIDGEPDVEIDMVADDWFFDPSHIVVEEGDHVRLNIESRQSQTGTYDHGIHIPALGVDQYLEAGETHQVDFEADELGEHEFYCNVFCGDGHHQMDGTIEVVEEGEAGDTGEELEVRDPEHAQEQLEYEKTEDGFKEFNLTTERIEWDYGGEEDNVLEAWSFNGQIPGPEIRVQEGDDLRINVENRLPDPTTVHWHGVDVPVEADGVPGVTQDPIESGETFTYEFEAVPAGTRFYHTHGSHHGDEGDQLNKGLFGSLIIEPEEFDEPDVDYSMVLSERLDQNIFPINGQVYPDVPPIEVEEGDEVRVRMINAGATTFHPMHLHGHQFDVVARDGNPIPEENQEERNTFTVHPGETADIVFDADNPGDWVFHCHHLGHSEQGMIAEVVYN